MIVGDNEGLGAAPDHINFDIVKHKLHGIDTKNLAALIINISSPGGLPVQTDRISTYIKSSFSSIPIICFIEEMAASGGYWLACTAQEIYATRSSVVGSIGVISQGFGFSSALDKIGIERRIITAGNCKSIMDPFAPVNKDEMSVMTKMLEEIHHHFIDEVKESRGSKLKADDDTLFNGQVWTGASAAGLGLIDGIDHMENYIASRWGNNVEIVMNKDKESFLSKLLSLRRLSRMFSYSRDVFPVLV